MGSAFRNTIELLTRTVLQWDGHFLGTHDNLVHKMLAGRRNRLRDARVYKEASNVLPKGESRKGVANTVHTKNVLH